MPFPPPGHLPGPGDEPPSLTSLAVSGRFQIQVGEHQKPPWRLIGSHDRRCPVLVICPGKETQVTRSWGQASTSRPGERLNVSDTRVSSARPRCPRISLWPKGKFKMQIFTGCFLNSSFIVQWAQLIYIVMFVSGIVTVGV